MTSIIEDVSKLDLICKPSNLHGFVTLPNELLLEILSYFPPGPITILPASGAQIIRREMLRSLSEVCQRLRRILRPCLWQRVEVYAGMRAGDCGEQLNHNTTYEWPPRKPKKHFAKELLRQLNVVTIQDPDLAQYVRMVDIEVNAATFRPVFDELGRCFPLFPNLHTVKIVTEFINGSGAETAMRAAKRGFKKKIPYPQIRSAILSPSVYPLLAVCPNLESLTTRQDSPLLLKFVKGLSTLQKFSGALSLRHATAIAEDLPSLQQITISLRTSEWCSISQTTQLLKTIQLFPNLTTLNLLLCRFSGFTSLSTIELRQAFLDLQPRDRHNLKEVVFSWTPSGEEERLVFSEFDCMYQNCRM